MTCPEAVSRLDGFVDDDLPPAEADQVREHINTCKSCRVEYELTLRLKQLLSTRTTPDPGQDYFNETENLVLARTVDNAEDDVEERPATSSERRSNRRQALWRAVLSVAASVVILFVAIYIGSSQDDQASRRETAEAPVLATAGLQDRVGPAGLEIFADDDRVRMARGILLMGSPGPLGRFSIFPEIITTLTSEES